MKKTQSKQYCIGCHKDTVNDKVTLSKGVWKLITEADNHFCYRCTECGCLWDKI